MATKFVIKLSRGDADAEPVGQALTVASTALASGVEVELWLMGDAVRLARAGVVEEMTLAHAPPLIDLWNAVAEGGKVFACTQCMLRREMTPEDLRSGVTQAGAPAFVAALAANGAVSLDF